MAGGAARSTWPPTGGFERETVLSYLRFFGRLAGRGASVDAVAERFGLGAFRRTPVRKIPAQADAATLIFDPREIDFIESMNKTNYVSVRGELYPTPLTMDEHDGDD